MPPPRVSPPTPVVEMIPPVVASPNGYAAALRSPQVAPPPTRAVWFSGSTRTPRIDERSMTIPSSHGAEARHAVRATADRDAQAVLAREPDGGHHVAGVRRLDDRGRLTVDHRVVDLPRLVVALVRGRGQRPPQALAQLLQSCCVHACAS